MEAHDQHQATKGEKPLREGAGHGKQLLEQAPFLHEQDPAHGGDVGRRHKGHHEHDIHPAVFCQLGPGQEIGRRRGDDCGTQNDTHAQQQGVEDGLKVFFVRDDGPGLG